MKIKSIFQNGYIELENQEIIKILKVTPINFNLKTQLEKDAILNSYKILFKTCSFDIQIIIQSKKEDLSHNIKFLNKKLEEEKNKKIKELSQEYISFITQLNQNEKSSSKNYFILLKNSPKNIEKNKDILIPELEDNYFKIKECITRCGNKVEEINSQEEIKNILKSFFNKKQIEKEEVVQ